MRFPRASRFALPVDPTGPQNPSACRGVCAKRHAEEKARRHTDARGCQPNPDRAGSPGLLGDGGATVFPRSGDTPVPEGEGFMRMSQASRFALPVDTTGLQTGAWELSGRLCQTPCEGKARRAGAKRRRPELLPCLSAICGYS